MSFHVPVMVTEVLEYLAPRSGGIYVDLTAGDGGHMVALLEASRPDGRVIGLDVDAAAIERAQARLARFGARAQLIHENYASGVSVVQGQHIAAVDGIVADLGVSSQQLDVAGRGFSFQKTGPLDMRMDRSRGVTAAELVNTASEQELVHWLYTYGEERFAKRIARALCARRAVAPIQTTAELAEVVRGAMPGAARSRGGRRIDPATRVFQALRIVVNGELLNVERMLETAPRLLQVGGRLAVMSYHSLEDRLVKHRFRRYAVEEGFHLVMKRPIAATVQEVRENPRARSAKLRVLERR
ncbi:MAG: 16S rRNA (cytosine(1402)-N(4))-methyltransferase RsmH [Deltaproteobacteria bacterium]|nr:16S rRNA (cytosine(1402)-N(4))-methyltransferase RsmH [Deltaproteobacteria bacterium]